MDLKTCTQCHAALPLSEFYPKSYYPGQYMAACKPCLRKKNLARYYANTEKVAAYERMKAKTDPNFRKRQREASRKARERHPERVRARTLANMARDRGELVQAPCIHCGVAKTVMHHRDYSKPLDIVWVCHQCHFRIEHKDQRAPR